MKTIKTLFTHRKKGAEFQSLFFHFTELYGRIKSIYEWIKNVFFERIYENGESYFLS